MNPDNILAATRLIMRHLASASTADNDNHLDILHLSLTSRLSLAAAIPILWNPSPPTTTIFLTIAPDLWDCEEVGVVVRDTSEGSVSATQDPSTILYRLQTRTTDRLLLRRPIHANDWARMQFYTSHVTELVLPPNLDEAAEILDFSSSFSFEDDSLTSFLLAAAPHHLPLFPNIRKLDLLESMTPYARLYVGESVTDISLQHFEDSEDGISFISTLPSRCPNITQIDLHTFPVDTALAKTFIDTWGGLRMFKCGILSANGLVRLSTAAHLEHLEFAWPDDPVDEIDYARVVPGSFANLDFSNTVAEFEAASVAQFPSLRSLQITGLDVAAHLIPIVTIANLPSLRSISVNTCELSKFVGFAVDWAAFFASVREGCSGAEFHSLHIVDGHTHSTNIHPESPILNARAVIEVKTLEPLLSFHALTEFVCDVVSGYDLDDVGLTRMAQAWPSLQVLGLSSERGWLKRSRVTLDGLTCLIRLCPRLVQVGIVIDASNHTFLTSTAPPVHNYNIVAFSIGNSLVAQEKWVAAYLSDLTPNLTRISSWGVPYRDDMIKAYNIPTAAAELYASRWSAIEDLVQVFTRVRKEQAAVPVI